jgi:hypothetical protein
LAGCSPARPAVEALEDRLAPAVTLSISNPLPFPEGDSGTSNMVFVVTRSGDLSPAVQVNYTTQDGTEPNGARAGIDYVASRGTLTLASNQTTATIAVPVIGNTLLQPDRSFTVVLSSPEPAASFAPQQTFATGKEPYSVALEDINGDGRPDLLVANLSSNTVSVLLNTTAAVILGTATFNESSQNVTLSLISSVCGAWTRRAAPLDSWPPPNASPGRCPTAASSRAS